MSKSVFVFACVSSELSTRTPLPQLPCACRLLTYFASQVFLRVLGLDQKFWNVLASLPLTDGEPLKRPQSNH